ncbi:MAG TPA: hypothetical protein VIS06_07595 [Mycobacteriales bacterium]
MTGHGNSDPDPDVEQLAGLAGAPTEVLQRALVAVMVVHPLDSRGRCRTCAPWWRWRPTRGGCPTRDLLRLIVA